MSPNVPNTTARFRILSPDGGQWQDAEAALAPSRLGTGHFALHYDRRSEVTGGLRLPRNVPKSRCINGSVSAHGGRSS
jgi:hypothetical protein